MSDRELITDPATSAASYPQALPSGDVSAGDRWVNQRAALEGVGKGRTRVDGRELIVLCANDYLGFAVDPRVIAAATTAMSQFGFGARGGRKQVADSSLHRELEAELADLKKMESCLLFSSAYMCNVGVIDALLGEGDLICSDEYNHPSIEDGSRLSGAEVRTYPHSDVRALASIVSAADFSTAMIATDSVFSMHGDVAPLAEVHSVAAEAGALLLVDDSHGLGVLGRGGEGAAIGTGGADMIVGSLGKAFGSVGGFVAAKSDLIDFLAARARTLSFDTALPPPAVAAALAAVQLMKDDPEPVQRLRRNAQALRIGLRDLGYEVGTSDSAIIPLHFADFAQAEALSRALYEEGVFVTALDSTYLPGGTALIRVIASAAHTEADIDLALAAFGSAGRSQG